MPLASSDKEVRVPPAARELAAQLCDVSVTYGEDSAAVHAVRSISLDVRRGEVLLLMGPSGSGKTTLLQVLGCMRTPTTGHVVIAGTATRALDGNALSRLRRDRIGFVFQNYNLLPSLRAWENVALALEVRGVVGSSVEQRSRELLTRLKLHDRLDSFPETLSGGEKQRVAIARAIVGNPDIILADEPTAALDTESGSQVAQVLAEIAHSQGHAVVIVTHDPRISGIADRIAILEDGAIRSIRGNDHASNRPVLEKATQNVEDCHRGSINAVGSRGPARVTG